MRHSLAVAVVALAASSALPSVALAQTTPAGCWWVDGMEGGTSIAKLWCRDDDGAAYPTSQTRRQTRGGASEDERPAQTPRPRARPAAPRPDPRAAANPDPEADWMATHPPAPAKAETAAVADAASPVAAAPQTPAAPVVAEPAVPTPTVAAEPPLKPGLVIAPDRPNVFQRLWNWLVALFGDLAGRLFDGPAGATFSQAARAAKGGAGVAPDFTGAAILYEKAARAGNGKAANNLAVLLLTGKGVPRSTEAACYWLRQAEKAKNTDSAEALARCKEQGLGVNAPTG